MPPLPFVGEGWGEGGHTHPHLTSPTSRRTSPSRERNKRGDYFQNSVIPCLAMKQAYTTRQRHAKPSHCHTRKAMVLTSYAPAPMVEQQFFKKMRRTTTCHSARSEESLFDRAKSYNEILRFAQNDKVNSYLGLTIPHARSFLYRLARSIIRFLAV